MHILVNVARALAGSGAFDDEPTLGGEEAGPPGIVPCSPRDFTISVLIRQLVKFDALECGENCSIDI
jgi:hypothetical protein